MLEAAGMRPRHRFGQNFMIDQNLVRIVADAGQIAAGDLVIEVGPGTGSLTEELLSRAGAVVAVEIDRDLAGLLRARLAGNVKFSLIEGDALDSKHELNAQLAGTISRALQDGRRPKLVANLPYNIASPLIIDLLIEGTELLAFTVQKEVAERLRATAGTKEYGVLSIMAQLLGEVEVLRTLPAQAFWPAPKIESALVRIRRRDRLGERAGAFGRFVQCLFSARRKTLRKSLAMAGMDAEKALGASGIEGQLRPEDVSPEDLLRLFGSAKT